MAFTQMTIAQFEALVRSFNWRRKINAVHMHHTWRPNHQQYRGQSTIQAMWRYHTQVNGWSDIAQHISIAPDGTIWTGRAWNTPPASASGHNGNSAAGPFMFEIIGDFDAGKDPFTGAQRDTVLRIIVALQKRFSLPPESLRFHNQMSSKSCPGSSIDYHDFLEEVRARHAGVRGGAEEAPTEQTVDWTLIGAVSNERAATDPADSEPRESGLEEFFYEAESRGENGLGAAQGRGPTLELTSTVLDALRPHVINLNQGHFSDGGTFQSDEGQVRAIFEQHLLSAVRTAELEGKLPLRVVFYAHGGLVSETNALRTAFSQIQWWKANRNLNREANGKNYSVYPIYFVWETGFLETLGQLLSRIRLRTQRAVRDVFDFTTDPVIEIAVRAFQGPTMWGGMKFSAEQASRAGGGAHFAAECLAELCSRPEVQGKIELHAIGHSAGAIFHAHFAPVVQKALRDKPESGLTGFEGAYFMAPALRVDEFKKTLGGAVGDGQAIERLSMFTMVRDVERDDNCAQIYRKSLLYLIYYAFERDPKTDILGLEESIRRDPELRKLFGLSGAGGPGEIVWSPSPLETGRSASRSRSHGSFDNDAPTMNSILRRVCGLDDNDPIQSFPEEHGRGLEDWESQVDWPEELEFLNTPSKGLGIGPDGQGGSTGVSPAGREDGTRPTVGSRRALCVGIDEYPTAPLGGCVADARLWSETLGGLGFREVHTLYNGQATRVTILDRLRSLLTASRSGDVVVFQFAGHGTQARDLSGDEAEGDTPALDEAICPFDFADGRLLIDDDLAEVFRTMPEGVCVTCFIDCCHSGTITRFGAGGTLGAGSTERARFLKLTPEQVAAHLRFRRSLGVSRAVVKRGPSEMREIVFSACTSDEVALESDGHGHFTVRATQVLRTGTEGISNREFQRRVTEAFGPAPKQHPVLDCSPASEELLLLCPAAARPTGTAQATSASQAPPVQMDGKHDAEILGRAFRAAADVLLGS